MIFWCSFCCAAGDRLSEEESDLHLEHLGRGCPHRTAPCTADGCRRGDHRCVNKSLTSIGCEDCRWTGYCPKCKGSGDANPTESHKREYRNAARRERYHRARTR